MPRHKSAHVGICIPDGSPASSGPLKGLHTFKMASGTPSLHCSQASHYGGHLIDGAPTQGAGIAVRDPEEVSGHCSKWHLARHPSSSPKLATIEVTL